MTEHAGAPRPDRPTPRHRPRTPQQLGPSPVTDMYLQMKWGLKLLGDERAKEYLAWIEARRRHIP